MFKNILEGFALGALVAGLGVKNVLFWLLIIIAVMMVGVTVFGLQEQGHDLSVLYTILSYAGKILFVLVLFFLGRGLIRNPKLLLAAILLILTMSFMNFFLGIGGWQGSVTLFISLTVPLFLVWIIDRVILSIKAKIKSQEG